MSVLCNIVHRVPSIHRSKGSTPVGVQCPLTSSLGEFPGYWTGSGILGYCPCWCPSPFLSPSIAWCFSIHSSSPAIGLHSCFFFTTDVSAPIRSTLQLLTFSVSLQAWDWLCCPLLWSQRRNSGAHGTEISIQISALSGLPALAGVE